MTASASEFVSASASVSASVLLPLAVLAGALLLVGVLSAVYIWSGDTGRRSRAWRVLRALLGVVGRGRDAQATAVHGDRNGRTAR